MCKFTNKNELETDRSLQVTCNSPSYNTAAECCSFAYAGQGSNTCYTTAGIPVPTPAPVAAVPGVPAAGTWYPDYPAGWEAGKCINTSPLPPYGSRPLYATQLECCNVAYAGQANNFCIANMDGLPTSQYGTQWYPKYDTTDTCTTKLPLPPPGSRQYFASKEECCQSTFASWNNQIKVQACINGSEPTSEPMLNPTPRPTSKPTNKPTLNTSPTQSPTESPTQSPTTASPTNPTLTYSSGSISVDVPDESEAGVTTSIDVAAPVGNVITNLRVKINLTHPYIADMVINLKAPNGKVLNLFNRHGGSGENLVNTVISSQGTVAFPPPSVAPFTGTFKARALINVGPTGYVSDAASFAELYTIPSGTWTLAMRDSSGGDDGTLTSWEIDFF